MPNKWPLWTFLVGVGFTLIGITLGQFEHVNLLQYFHPVLNREVLPVLGTAAVAPIVQVFLASYVGDIAVYVNSDIEPTRRDLRRYRKKID